MWKARWEIQLIWIQASYRDFPISLQGFSINNNTNHNEDKYFAMNCCFFTQKKAIQTRHFSPPPSLLPRLSFTFVLFSWHISELEKKTQIFIYEKGEKEPHPAKILPTACSASTNTTLCGGLLSYHHHLFLGCDGAPDGTEDPCTTGPQGLCQASWEARGGSKRDRQAMDSLGLYSHCYF